MERDLKQAGKGVCVCVLRVKNRGESVLEILLHVINETTL